jgi:hypothetical protein
MQMATSTDTKNEPALKQQSLNGMGFPEVERLAVKLRDLQAKRMQMQVDEAALRESLLGAMGKAEITVFKFEEDGEKFIAKIKHGKTKVSVRKEKADEDANESE